jgi:putative transposase
MTAPRQVLPGATYLVTRRCAQRQFLLSPGGTTNEVFGYVLAVAALRFDVQVHAYCVLSNHFHLVVTDRTARLPAFEQYLDSLVARALNASLGRWESFWAPHSYSAVALTTPEDIIDKVAYVLANPVAAGLVHRGCDWPGLWSAPEGIGIANLLFRRPTTFFRANGGMPDTATLELVPPPGFHSAVEFQGRVVASLSALEVQARAAAASRGSSAQHERVSTAQPRTREPRRRLNPRVAGRDKWKRIEALSRLLAFLRSYREAWRARRAGDAAAMFPAGTYLLRVMHGVPCTAPS